MNYIGFTERARNKEWNMIKLESHPYFEIYFLVEGERTIIVRENILTVNKACAIIIPPFTPHRTEGGPYRRINAYVSPQILDEETLSYLNKQQAPLVFFLDESKRDFIYKILRVACSTESDQSNNVSEYKKGFLYAVLYQLKQCTAISMEAPVKKNHKTDRQLFDLVSYLNEHWNEKITLEFLCKTFFFTKTNLCNSFHKMMNCSIAEYLLFIRFEKAKEMLFNTDMDIQRIADECGFSSLNYFSLMFKKRIGISPSAYRKTR